MNQLGKRLWVSAVFITIGGLAIFVLPDWCFFLITEVFILLGLNELLSNTKNHAIPIHKLIPVKHCPFLFVPLNCDCYALIKFLSKSPLVLKIVTNHSTNENSQFGKKSLL